MRVQCRASGLYSHGFDAHKERCDRDGDVCGSSPLRICACDNAQELRVKEYPDFMCKKGGDKRSYPSTKVRSGISDG